MVAYPVRDYHSLRSLTFTRGEIESSVWAFDSLGGPFSVTDRSAEGSGKNVVTDWPSRRSARMWLLFLDACRKQ